MEFRWVVVLTLWTLFIGPIFNGFGLERPGINSAKYKAVKAAPAAKKPLP